MSLSTLFSLIESKFLMLKSGSRASLSWSAIWGRE